MQITREAPLKYTLKPSNHPYLSGPWTPVHEEVTVDELEVIEGEIPADIDGVYLRNTENPVHQPLGRHHPFDGDAMIHQVNISGGKASYRNRFVRTHCFTQEQIAGGALWGGLMDPSGTSKRPGFGAHGGLKDTASTDIIVHAGIAYSTMYQCGEAWMMDPLTLENLGKAPWGPIDGISAHPKVDEQTGEMMFFNYGVHAPYMHYGVIDRAGRLVHYVPIPLSGPRLPHDMAITKNWSILNDMPLFWDEELLGRDIHAARIHDGIPTRFALIPRHGQPEDIRWFEAAPTYVLHWTNAYEAKTLDGDDEVVLEGYYQDKPMPDPIEEMGKYSHMMAYVDEHSFQSRLHRWRFNLTTGECTEERLSDRIVEFGMINPNFAMKPSRYVWSTTTKPGWFLFNGYARQDTETGEEQVYQLPDGVFASESPIIPRKGSKSSNSEAVGQKSLAEDDAYLVTFLIDENTGSSELAILDASDVTKGPICRAKLPHKISSGVHATWVERDKLPPA
ncbi:MAG: carotenoid oxygenase family protein [Erythrobacter sp.]